MAEVFDSLEILNQDILETSPSSNCVLVETKGNIRWQEMANFVSEFQRELCTL